MRTHPAIVALALLSMAVSVAHSQNPERETALRRLPPPLPAGQPSPQALEDVGAFTLGGQDTDAWNCDSAENWLAVGDSVGRRGTVGWPMRGNVPENTYRTSALGVAWIKSSWSYSPGANTYVWRPAVAPDGTIYVTTVFFPATGVDGKLVALYPGGGVKWSVPLTNSASLPVWASCTPALDDLGNIYIAWAHDKDFKQLTALSFTPAGVLRWRFEPNIELETASHQEPVLANGVLYAALDTSFYIGNPTHRASMFAINPANGKPLWHWKSPNLDTFFDGPAIGSDGAVYHASAANPLREAHGWLYRIRPDGTLDWSRDLGLAGVNAPPALDPNGDIYLGDLAGIAWKFSPDGTLLWTYDTLSGRIYTSPALTDRRVLIGACYGGLQVLDAGSGQYLTTFAPTYYPMGKSADRAGNAFFYCWDYQGTVFGFGRGGHQWWAVTTGAGVSVNACIVARDGVVLVSNTQVLKQYAGFFQGDLNCDGSVDFGDINPFVLALTDPVGYQAAYPNCNIILADCNGDGAIDFGDINPFVALLTGP